MPAGYDKLTSWMYNSAVTAGALFCCGRIVESVRWKRGGVELRVLNRDSGSIEIYEAERLVSTLPLGVLQQEPGIRGAVVFEPELSSKKHALQGLAMGQTVRLSLRFRSKWWQERSGALGFIYSPQDLLSVWWTCEPGETPILVAWAGGPRAEELLVLSRDALVAQALNGLAQLFGIKEWQVKQELEDSCMHDWRADPFAYGSYSYVLVGGLKSARLLAAPIEETLYFAGEATNTQGHAGTVHGAIASGKRAAREIIER